LTYHLFLRADSFANTSRSYELDSNSMEHHLYDRHARLCARMNQVALQDSRFIAGIGHLRQNILDHSSGYWKYISYGNCVKSRDSSVGIATGYGLDGRGSRFRFPTGAGNFSLHHRVQNGGCPPSLLSSGYPRLFPLG
jgi:hypothetical protein